VEGDLKNIELVKLHLVSRGVPGILGCSLRIGAEAHDLYWVSDLLCHYEGDLLDMVAIARALLEPALDHAT